MKLSFPKLKKRHKEILTLIKTKKVRLLLAMGCMLIIAAATSATAFLVKPVLDDVFINQDATMLKILSATVVLIFVMRGLAMYGQEF
ncbi:hypothetical protein ACFLZM_07010 [Thermodesulfobacteriota bacterium]